MLVCAGGQILFGGAHRVLLRVMAPVLEPAAAAEAAAVAVEVAEPAAAAEAAAVAVEVAEAELRSLMDMQDDLLTAIAGRLATRDWASFAAVSKAAKAVAEGGRQSVLSSEIARRLLAPRNVGKALCRRWPDMVVPAGVAKISSYAFCYCESLTSISLPEGVTVVGSNAFYRCSALASVTLPRGLTTVGNMAFWGCRALTSVTLPKGLASIGHGAFAGCLALDPATRDAIAAINPHALK